jgi:hypothetical protein
MKQPKPLFLLFILLFIGTSHLFSHPPFGSGEKLVFKFHYGIITGGAGMFLTSDTVINNRPVLHTKFTVGSTGLMDKIMRVRNVYESYYDENTLTPVRSRMDIKEGKFEYYDEVTYFQAEEYLESKKNGRTDMPKGEHTLDIISAIFNARLYDWDNRRVNDTVTVQVYFRNKLFPMHVVYKGKERVNTDTGKIVCIKLVPKTAPGTLFKKDEEMTVWFSDDNHKIPVCLSMKLAIGAVKFTLTEVTYD